MAKATRKSTPKRFSRPTVEALISILIDHLDTLDDTDLEPSLGFSTGGCFPEHAPQEGAGFHLNVDAGRDLEDEHDGAEPPEDSEPSLGWTHNPNQTSAHWNQVAPTFWGATDIEQGIGPVKKKRPTSKTGNRVVYAAEVLR